MKKNPAQPVSGPGAHPLTCEFAETGSPGSTRLTPMTRGEVK